MTQPLSLQSPRVRHSTVPAYPHEKPHGSANSKIDGIFRRQTAAIQVPQTYAMERQRLNAAVFGVMQKMNLQPDRPENYFRYRVNHTQEFQHNGQPAYIQQQGGAVHHLVGFSGEGQSRLSRMFAGGAGQYQFSVERETNGIEQLRGPRLTPTQMAVALEELQRSM
ncbi:hypothetical protein ACSFA3_15000 [Variovorax sp. RHLX14]|uniref:hypothetical protein n=1 Tax=Variovorax sp. RHLX14 TaxID=1259731 RepID=UPI003F488DC2